MTAWLLALLLPCTAPAEPPAPLSYYEDRTASLTAEQIVARQGELPWAPVTVPKLNFGYSDSRFWVKMDIPAYLPITDSWLIEVPYSYNEKIGFYVVAQGRIASRSFAGLAVPSSERGSGTLRTAFPTFRVLIPHASGTVLLASVEGKFPIAFPVNFHRGHDFAWHYGSTLLLLGIFLGIYLLAFLSNASLAISLRSSLYGDYAAFVASLLMLFLAHEGLTIQYLWPNSPWWAMRELDLYGGLAILFYAFFVSEFLELRRRDIWLHRFLFAMVALSSVRTVWMLVHPYRPAQMLGVLAVAISNLIVLVAAARALWRGLHTARYFLLASIVYNAGYFLFLIQGANLWWIGEWVDWAPIAGSAMEVTLLSFALADRIRQTDRELIQQRIAVVQADKLGALGRMAGEIAHEISNPLAIIHGNATLLRSQEASAQVKEFAGTIEATALRISNVVRGMRALARDSRQDPFQPTPLSNILQDTMLFCRERSRNVDFKLLQPPGDLVLRCRSSEISQVLVNLLNNAFDALEGLPSPWVRLEASLVEGCVELSVSDSGRGVPRELRTKIQEPFFTTKEAGRGLGLGLSIARTIVESHGGKLWLDEACSHTRFVFTVPVSR